ncbi:hypothetical protein [Flavobacterium sp.]|uniref:hypothetical protein n=1 Tax=Flavobacterium sp. TaxID=239 RepID=UPI0025BD4130|nr:hypothetical protein [Flavobacterium sp.]
MKNLIKIAILFVAISASAQTKNIKTSGTQFVNGVEGKSWSNATSLSGTVDKFKDFTGETYVTFFSELPAKIALDYVLTLTKGECEVVFSGEENTCNLAHISLRARGTGVNNNMKTFNLEPGVEYRLTLKGENAKGKFKCNWTEID